MTNQSGSTDFISHGRPDVEEPGTVTIAADRGLEVVADIPYPPGTNEWGSIATQLRDADPDVIVANGLGVESVGLLQAMEQLGYRPPLMFSLFPAPGRSWVSASWPRATCRSRCSSPTSRSWSRWARRSREIVEEFTAPRDRGGAAVHRLRDPGGGLVDGVGDPGRRGRGRRQPRPAGDLRRPARSRARTRPSTASLTFDPAVNNFWPTTQGIKQIQDGDWVMVWPEDRAAAPAARSAGLTCAPDRRTASPGRTAATRRPA